MYNAMLNAQLDDTFKERMKDWHQLFSDYMADDGSIDSREMEILRTDYMNMADEAKKIRDNVAEITGYSTSSQQSTTASQISQKKKVWLYTAWLIMGEMKVNSRVHIRVSTAGR